MAYSDERNKAGRQPITFVEVDADFCPYTYGVNNGTTSLCNATDAEKCYNTRKTCKDADTYVANFDPATWEKTYTFANSSTGVPPTMGVFPTIVGLDTAPTRITPSKGLGERAVVKVSFQDHPHHDIGIDPYVDERTYTPMEQGTFWGKWKARNPYYRSRQMRVKTGYLAEGGVVDWANFVTYNYVIDSIAGPTANGRVTLTAKDPLTLLDGSRAVVPEPSRGELAADIDGVATSFSLAPAGIGDDPDYGYPATSFRCRIGDEGFDVTRSGDVCTVVQRGLYEGAGQHSTGDTVQVVKQYAGVQVQDIAYDLITAGRPELAQYIPKATWDAEADEYLLRLYTGEITEPTSVNELLTELMESCPFYIYWDERLQEITLSAIRPPGSGAITLTDDGHLLGGAVDVREIPKERVDEVWVYFGMLNPAGDRKKAENYAVRYVSVNPDAQSADQYGGRQIKKVFSRWITTTNAAAAQELAAQYLRRFGKTPIRIQVKLDARHSDIWTGDIAQLDTMYLQGPTGSNEPRYCQVVEAVEDVPGTRFQYEMITYDFVSHIQDTQNNVTIGNDENNVNLRELHDAGWDQVRDTIVFDIPAGVTVGSNDASTPAIDVGDWSDYPNTTIVIINNGRIEGRGGSGGAGAHLGDDVDVYARYPAVAGGAGGDAIWTNHPITIDNANGEIFGGGGGGGGGGSYVSVYISGGGGGGGAGVVGGAGGITHQPLPHVATPVLYPGSSGTRDAGGVGADGNTHSPLYYGDWTGGTGGTGGNPGEPGQAGSPGTTNNIYAPEHYESMPPASGGAAGRAITTNGRAITWTGGNNSTQVKGAVI